MAWDKPHLATHPSTSYQTHQRQAFSKCKTHQPTKKQYLKKTNVMKERHQAQNKSGHLRNHQANNKHSCLCSRRWIHSL